MIRALPAGPAAIVRRPVLAGGPVATAPTAAPAPSAPPASGTVSGQSVGSWLASLFTGTIGWLGNMFKSLFSWIGDIFGGSNHVNAIVPH